MHTLYCHAKQNKIHECNVWQNPQTKSVVARIWTRRIHKRSVKTVARRRIVKVAHVAAIVSAVAAIFLGKLANGTASKVGRKRGANALGAAIGTKRNAGAAIFGALGIETIHHSVLNERHPSREIKFTFRGHLLEIEARGMRVKVTGSNKHVFHVANFVAGFEALEGNVAQNQHVLRSFELTTTKKQKAKQHPALISQPPPA